MSPQTGRQEYCAKYILQIGMGRKSRQYTIFPLSVHDKTFCPLRLDQLYIYLPQFPRLPFRRLIYMPLIHLCLLTCDVDGSEGSADSQTKTKAFDSLSGRTFFFFFLQADLIMKCEWGGGEDVLIPEDRVPGVADSHIHHQLTNINIHQILTL